jgi:SRSO17 transposase
MYSNETLHTHAPIKSELAALDVCPAAIAELCATLLASLPRSDQRRRGLDYVRGLLEVRGRKSVRNIASFLGGPATEQQLHHFVASSTWDWRIVRRSLADHLAQVEPPEVWVVRSMFIPKAGEHSVGVDKCFVRDAGQVVNAQRATGLWAVSARMSAPVNWRLRLSASWLEDGTRRARASIPADVVAMTVAECAIETYLVTKSWRGSPMRPVVVDAHETELSTVIEKLGNTPFLARIDGTTKLVMRDRALPGRAGAIFPAREIMSIARDFRRRMRLAEPTLPHLPPAGAGSVVVAIRVGTLPGFRGGFGAFPNSGDLILIGEGQNGREWPVRLWLTNMVETHPADLLRLSRLASRVDGDFNRVADQVGVRDYAGRSFAGWHRHITLASIAHAIAFLSDVPHQEKKISQSASLLGSLGKHGRGRRPQDLTDYLSSDELHASSLTDSLGRKKVMTYSQSGATWSMT